MSHSFGEGYATRSDEEGFGGVYSDQNQSFRNTDGDRINQDINQPGLSSLTYFVFDFSFCNLCFCFCL